MVRFGFSRARRDVSAKAPVRVATASEALTDPRRDAPASGEVLFEIGLILALHLAFAVAVLLTLDAYGVT
jgi:hypothetical protein